MLPSDDQPRIQTGDGRQVSAGEDVSRICFNGPAARSVTYTRADGRRSPTQRLGSARETGGPLHP